MVGMQREMACSLSVVAQGWDVYHHTMEAIDTMQLTAPLVEGLHRYTYNCIIVGTFEGENFCEF